LKIIVFIKNHKVFLSLKINNSSMLLRIYFCKLAVFLLYYHVVLFKIKLTVLKINLTKPKQLFCWNKKSGQNLTIEYHAAENIDRDAFKRIESKPKLKPLKKESNLKVDGRIKKNLFNKIKLSKCSIWGI
jgi:hypothetical protein